MVNFCMQPQLIRQLRIMGFMILKANSTPDALYKRPVHPTAVNCLGYEVYLY